MNLDPASLIQAAPATALALLVYLELRAVRPILRGLELVLAGLLERERSREAGEINLPRVPTLRRARTHPGVDE